MHPTKGTPIRFAVGKNCNTLHAVPRELTDRRLSALMDAVYLHGSRDTRSLGWLAANGYVNIKDGQAFVTLWALPLVRAVKRHGWYYWAGAQEPSLTADDGRLLYGYNAFAYVESLRNEEPPADHCRGHFDNAIRAIKGA